MDRFLYDNGHCHERVNELFHMKTKVCLKHFVNDSSLIKDPVLIQFYSVLARMCLIFLVLVINKGLSKAEIFSEILTNLSKRKN